MIPYQKNDASAIFEREVIEVGESRNELINKTSDQSDSRLLSGGIEYLRGRFIRT